MPPISVNPNWYEQYWLTERAERVHRPLLGRLALPTVGLLALVLAGLGGLTH